MKFVEISRKKLVESLCQQLCWTIVLPIIGPSTLTEKNTHKTMTSVHTFRDGRNAKIGNHQKNSMLQELLFFFSIKI